MRDKFRLFDVQDRILYAWRRFPDMRLGQLLIAAVTEEGDSADDTMSRLFNMECEDIARRVERLCFK